ncbi:Fe-only nitrogenase accessory protein AnfO [Clostridium sp.]|uniref:Fe-only nitrogenase accessory protein AnfO n=1 Tax=Clostridium sp. TaxID=1506 RepID=UPI00284BA8D0|nr:Fe-only nitrogenase accessory protein AnfO [Clostridium sp.]MDR3597241.1 Fe-only nitrogenase accessory protein AnfO [Clostridium sp.]
MLKEIAVYVNSLGKVADLNEAGTIKIFSKDKDKWMLIRELLFKFHSIERKNDIRLDTINIAESLGSCKIFVAQGLPDLVFTMLDSMGVSIWKMDGDLSEIIEYVLEKEEEEAEEVKLINDSMSNKKRQITEPVEIGNNGYYILNLKELQKHNTGITSKQALKPFLKNVNFHELIVTCSHIPRWLEDELENLNLNFRFLKTWQEDYIIIIKNKLI